MNLWNMIVCVVALGVVSEMYRARIKARTMGHKARDHVDTLAARMEKLEERMANIETIVLEREKLKRFDELH